MKRFLKKILPLILSALLLFVLAACAGTSEPAETERPTETEQNILGQAMYDGTLYDVPNATTAIAFDETQEYEPAVLISPEQTPTADLECNLPGEEAQFAVYDNDLILIVDGEQYILK